MKKFIAIAITAAVVSTAAHAANPNVVGSQTAKADETYFIEVKSSTVPFGPHESDRAGIGVSNSFFGASSAVDFQGLTNSSKTKTKVDQGVTVYNLKKPIPDQGNSWWEFHRDLGVFNFVQVGSGDVWFGEWSKNEGNGKNVRQAYYVGDKSGTTLPAKGTIAKYNTYGINNFNGSNLLQGELTADFDKYELSGTLSHGAKQLKLEQVGINVADASFGYSDAAGKNKAKMLVNGHLQGTGDVRGHFFGAQAAALAGVADFGEANAKLNTAFGGTKN